MQALLLPSRLPPPLLRRGALSAAASLVSPLLHGANLPTGRLCCEDGEGAPRRLTVAVAASSSSSGPLYPTPPPTEQTIERAKLEQVIKRLEKTARHFKNLGSLGFWSQLVCTFVSAGILSFSTVVTGKVTSPITFYATAAGIVAAFISVFWSFGYIRLSERLRKTASAPAKAPPRADVVKSLKNGIVLNILGMGAAVLGMQATVGGLVAKSSYDLCSPLLSGNFLRPKSCFGSGCVPGSGFSEHHPVSLPWAGELAGAAPFSVHPSDRSFSGLSQRAAGCCCCCISFALHSFFFFSF